MTLPEPRLRSDDTLGVFVPGIMGAGIILSAVILIGDAVRKMLPSSRVKQEAEVARGVQGVVAGTAHAAGCPAGEWIGPRRVLRSRVFYALLAIACTMAASLLINGGVALYTSEEGLSGNPWVLGWGVGLGSACALIALGSTAVAVVYERMPAALRELVAETPVGRLRLPPAGYAERAARLVPSLREGDP